MERSEIRDHGLRGWTCPGLRFAPSGLRIPRSPHERSDMRGAADKNPDIAALIRATVPTFIPAPASAPQSRPAPAQSLRPSSD
ncbi:hypothetical protein E3H11_27800 [Bradyrhizobium brasilense]|nr:hypothetical protein [Bradyrhizobium brasilense]